MSPGFKDKIWLASVAVCPLMRKPPCSIKRLASPLLCARLVSIRRSIGVGEIGGENVSISLGICLFWTVFSKCVWASLAASGEWSSEVICQARRFLRSMGL